ncbi:hypothetical protein PMIN03_001414 [Paraphaeosphaeria minitans]
MQVVASRPTRREGALSRGASLSGSGRILNLECTRQRISQYNMLLLRCLPVLFNPFMSQRSHDWYTVSRNLESEVPSRATAAAPPPPQDHYATPLTETRSAI